MPLIYHYIYATGRPQMMLLMRFMNVILLYPVLCTVLLFLMLIRFLMYGLNFQIMLSEKVLSLEIIILQSTKQ